MANGESNCKLNYAASAFGNISKALILSHQPFHPFVRMSISRAVMMKEKLKSSMSGGTPRNAKKKYKQQNLG